MVNPSELNLYVKLIFLYYLFIKQFKRVQRFFFGWIPDFY